MGVGGGGGETKVTVPPLRVFLCSMGLHSVRRTEVELQVFDEEGVARSRIDYNAKHPFWVEVEVDLEKMIEMPEYAHLVPGWMLKLSRKHFG
jgi:hypothetical protein